MEEQYGSWIVGWLADGFTVRAGQESPSTFYAFPAVILPVAILGGTLQGFRAGLLAESGSRTEILGGVEVEDLKRFKRRLSGEVLAAVKRSAGGCADCAFEAGRFATAWTSAPCSTCRQRYCSNVKCLRRWKTVTGSERRPLCKYCGAPGGTGEAAGNLESTA